MYGIDNGGIDMDIKRSAEERNEDPYIRPMSLDFTLKIMRNFMHRRNRTRSDFEKVYLEDESDMEEGKLKAGRPEDYCNSMS